MVRMYISGNKLLGMPVVSLQTGQALAMIDGLVLDYRALEAVALLCAIPRRPAVVVITRDIREWAKGAVLVNSEDDLSEAADIVRLQPLLDENFKLTGTLVKTELGSRLGRVESYTIDTETGQVQKLYVKQSVLRNILVGNLTVDRSQIVDASPKLITVRDASIKEPAALAQPIAPK